MHKFAFGEKHRRRDAIRSFSIIFRRRKPKEYYY